MLVGIHSFIKKMHYNFFTLSTYRLLLRIFNIRCRNMCLQILRQSIWWVWNLQQISFNVVLFFHICLARWQIYISRFIFESLSSKKSFTIRRCPMKAILMLWRLNCIIKLNDLAQFRLSLQEWVIRMIAIHPVFRISLIGLSLLWHRLR